VDTASSITRAHPTLSVIGASREVAASVVCRLVKDTVELQPLRALRESRSPSSAEPRKMDSPLLCLVFEVLVGEICPSCAYHNSTHFSSASSRHSAQYKPLITAIPNSMRVLGDIDLRSLCQDSSFRPYIWPCSNILTTLPLLTTRISEV